MIGKLVPLGSSFYSFLHTKTWDHRIVFFSYNFLTIIIHHKAANNECSTLAKYNFSVIIFLFLSSIVDIYKDKTIFFSYLGVLSSIFFFIKQHKSFFFFYVKVLDNQDACFFLQKIVLNKFNHVYTGSSRDCFNDVRPRWSTYTEWRLLFGMLRTLGLTSEN